MKTFRASALLLLCVVAVFGWLWWREREPALPPGVQVVARFAPATITNITLKTANQPTLRLQKDGENWTIARQVLASQTAPVAVPADGDLVQQFLQAFATLRSDAIIDPKKIGEYGLETPRASVELDNKIITFGAPPFFDAGRIYARVDDRVTLLPGALAQLASRPFEQWRDRRVARFEAATIARITLGVERKIVLKKTRDSAVSPSIGGENWRVSAPLDDAGDSEQIAVLLQALQGAQVTKFLDNVGENWGFDTPTAQLAFDGDAPILTIGRKTSAGYAARGRTMGAPFVVGADVVQLLSRPLDYWRSHRLLSFDLNAIERVTLRTGGQTLEYARAGGRWKSANGATPSAGAASVADILVAVRDWRAQKFVAGELPVATDFELTLRIAGQAAQTLRVASVRGQWLAQVSGKAARAPALYAVSEAAMENLHALTKRLLAAEPTPAPAQIGPRI